MTHQYMHTFPHKTGKRIQQRCRSQQTSVSFPPISMDSSPHPQNPSSAAGNGGLPSSGASATPSPAPAPTPSADPAEEAKQNLGQVINSIDKTLGLLHQLYITVSSFSVASQLPLLQRLNTLVAELDAMQKMADKCNIQVPMEVVNLIDDGKNPDEFTRAVINSCIAKNQITKGKTDAFKSLRRYLLEELDQAFPEEVETYREIRASSAAESKRLAQSQNILPNGDVKIKSEH